MKKIFAAMMVIGFFQQSVVVAQEDGSARRHGRSRDESGTGNFDSSRTERARPSENQGEKAQPPSEEKPANTVIEKKHGSRQGGQTINRTIIRKNNALDTAGKIGAPGFKPGGAGQETNVTIHRNLRDEGSPSNKGNMDRSPGFENAKRNTRPGSFVGETRRGTAPIPSKVRAMGITRVPEPIRDHSRILSVDRKHSTFLPPKEGVGGKPIGAKLIASKAISGKLVQNHMMAITGNASFLGQINVYNRSETRKNNYYWHQGNGFNYCHYYDDWGYHWYGWYLGPRFFWTRYYFGNWWWYDGMFDRWCYWHDGGWWWQDPAGLNVVYVYNSGIYTPVQTSVNQSSNESNQVVYQSNDGTRKVKVMGDTRDAFLYDSTDSPSFDPVYLASSVKEVKFSDTSNQKPLQIMLILNDGTFQLFDGYGNSYRGKQDGQDQ